MNSVIVDAKLNDSFTCDLNSINKNKRHSSAFFFVVFCLFTQFEYSQKGIERENYLFVQFVWRHHQKTTQSASLEMKRKKKFFFVLNKHKKKKLRANTVAKANNLASQRSSRIHSFIVSWSENKWKTERKQFFTPATSQTKFSCKSHNRRERKEEKFLIFINIFWKRKFARFSPWPRKVVPRELKQDKNVARRITRKFRHLWLVYSWKWFWRQK